MFPSELLSTVDLCTRFQTTLPTGANPLHGIRILGYISCPGAPGDNELPRSPAAGDAVYNDRLPGRVMLVHQIEESLNLSIGGNPIIGHIDVMIGKLLRNILTVVELTAIDDSPDLLFFVDLEDIGIRPPGRRDDVFDDPGERLGSFRLTLFRPIPRANEF